MDGAGGACLQRRPHHGRPDGLQAVAMMTALGFTGTPERWALRRVTPPPDGAPARVDGSAQADAVARLPSSGCALLA